ncbi:MAG: hypothetical protein HQL52_03775 [Magnetococcales bacterium]|nr:hypothetical protein [Magnetococcales bacterium]
MPDTELKNLLQASRKRPKKNTLLTLLYIGGLLGALGMGGYYRAEAVRVRGELERIEAQLLSPITPEQRESLSLMVMGVVKRTGQPWQGVWARVHRRLGVRKASEITRGQYGEAVGVLVEESKG